MAMNIAAGAGVKPTPELQRSLTGLRQRLETAEDRLDAMLGRFASRPGEVTTTQAPPLEPMPTYENTLHRVESVVDRIHAHIDALETRI